MIEQENVVEITDFGSTPGGSVFFAMEYLNGEDLAATIKRDGSVPWPRVRQILLQICSALGLGSAMCLALFVGLWLWYRSTCNKVRGECRRFISNLLDARLRPETCRGEPVVPGAPYLSVYHIQPTPDTGSSGAVPLRKAG